MFDFGNANDAQKLAISSSNGAVLITAGPGTGKTFTLVQRAIYLIQECGVKPEQILMATFTEKAAKELVTRITNELAVRNIYVNVNEMYIGTFHSLCLRIIKDDFLDSSMTDIMACSKDPDDLMARIQYFLYLIIGQKRYYLCLNEDCLGEHEIVGEISTVPKEYTENMVLYIRSVDGKNRTLHDPFELKEIFPDLDEERESPCAFFITPVHFIDRCYGYAVLSYGDEIKSIDITYRNWTNHVSNALESMRIRNSIANLAVRDAMTGVYSRIGIEKNIQFVVDRMSNPKNKAFIAVCDLDCLKKINDNFGHNSGDIAIKAIADAVLASTKNHEICARVGGDEFVVIGCNDYNDNYPERFSARVNDRLRVYNKFAGNEFEVSVSIGGICKHITDIHELEDMFTQADKIMYASKLERHKNRK